MQCSKVLVGYDGSEHANGAIRVGAEFAEKYGGELLLLAVFNPAALYAIQAFTPAAVLTQHMIEKDALTWQEGVEKSVKDILTSQQTDYRFLREIGNPVEKILAVAEREKVDMIVVGSRGRGGFERLLLGSVSDAVVHHAPCSVLIVR